MVIDEIVEKGILARILICKYIVNSSREITHPLYECGIGGEAYELCKYCDRMKRGEKTLYLCYIRGVPPKQKNSALEAIIR